MTRDVAPELVVEETAYGLRPTPSATRPGDATTFALPISSCRTGRLSTEPQVDPIKETPARIWAFRLTGTSRSTTRTTASTSSSIAIDDPVAKEYLENLLLSETAAPFELKRNARNRYLQSREEIRASTYVGMGHNFQAHDRFAVESQRPISDRTREHLGVTDVAVIAMRKQLLNAVGEVQNGRDPLFVNHDASRNPLSEMIVRAQQIPAETPIKDFWKAEAIS